MTTAIFVVAVLPALLVAAAVFDLMSYTIPNVIPGAMILLFVSFMIVVAWSGQSMSWSETGLHFLCGAIGLAALMSGKVDVKGKVAVAVLSGGNVDADLFYRLVA